jgi:hypothetical protein
MTLKGVLSAKMKEYFDEDANITIFSLGIFVLFSNMNIELKWLMCIIGSLG